MVFGVYGGGPVPQDDLRIPTGVPDGGGLRGLLRRMPLAQWLVCPTSGSTGAWSIVSRRLRECVSCGRQVSVTAGTILHRTKTDLRPWLLAAFLMVADKRGLSALSLQRQIRVKRYDTAWTMSIETGGTKCCGYLKQPDRHNGKNRPRRFFLRPARAPRVTRPTRAAPSRPVPRPPRPAIARTGTAGTGRRRRGGRRAASTSGRDPRRSSSLRPVPGGAHTCRGRRSAAPL